MKLSHLVGMTALVTILAYSPNGYSQSTKSALTTELGNDVYTNGQGKITGQNLRQYLTDQLAAQCGLAQASDCVLPPGVAAANLPALGGDLLGSSMSSPTVAPGAITATKLDAQAADFIKVSPQFCPYANLTGTPANDNDVCFQNAINYACAVGSSPAGYVGGELVLARAPYYVLHASVPAACAGLKIRGQGFGPSGAGSYLVTDNTCTKAQIEFYPDATQNYIQGGGVSDLFLFNNTLTGGVFTGATSCPNPLILSHFSRNTQFSRLSVLSPMIAIKLIGGMNNTISDIAVDQALQGSTGVFELMGTGPGTDLTPTQNAVSAANRQDVTYLSRITVFGAPSTGVNQWYVGIWNHGLSQTLRINQAAFENASTALQVDCTGGGAVDITACPGNSYVYDLETEGAGSNQISLQDTQDWYFTTAYAAAFGKAASATLTSGTYTSATGILSLTFSVAPFGTAPAVGSVYLPSGLTGTGSVASLDFDWPLVSSSGSGTTLNLQAPTGLGTITITGGTLAQANPGTLGAVTNVSVKNVSFTTTGQISFENSQFNGAQGSCMDYSGYQLSLHNSMFYGCNASNVGASDVTLEAPTLPSGALYGDADITGNHFCTGPAGNYLAEPAVNFIAGTGQDYNVFALNVLHHCGIGVNGDGTTGSVGTHGIKANNTGL